LISGRIFRGEMTPIPGSMIFLDKNPSDDKWRISPNLPCLHAYIPMKRMMVEEVFFFLFLIYF